MHTPEPECWKVLKSNFAFANPTAQNSDSSQGIGLVFPRTPDHSREHFDRPILAMARWITLTVTDWRTAPCT